MAPLLCAWLLLMDAAMAQVTGPVDPYFEPQPTPAKPGSPADQEPESLQQVIPDILPPPSSIATIDLPTALWIAEGQNPEIGLSRERICETIALRKAARALWIPTLNAGTNYHLHAGVLQTSFGEIRNLNEQSLYVGGGARTLAAESVAIPAVRIFAHLGDAYYSPLAAAQTVMMSRYDAQAVHNLTLLDVADRYLALVSAEARREAMRATLLEVGQVAAVTEAFARTGQGRDADARRARSAALLFQLEEQRIQEDAGVAAAELSRVLHLDPSVRLVTSEGPIEIVELVNLNTPVETLVAMGQHRRPEVSSRSSQIQRAEFRLRQEITRPYLPLLSVGFSGGAFGGGSNRQDLGVSSFWQRMGGRSDFDVMALWTLQNLGVGNDALQKRECADREEAIRQRSLAIAQVRNEVTQYLARAQAQERAMNVAWRLLSAAEKGTEEDLVRIRAGEGLPIEALNNLNRLAAARLRLINTVIDYNRTQFELFVALGSSPR